MKHVIVMALGAALALASCVSKGTVVKVEEQRDSLSVVVSAKDSLISAVFEDISSISENLALIRTRENLISVAGDAEGGRRPVEEINNDIAAIDRLLQENKVKIASLQSAVAQLRKANLRLDGLEKMIRDMSAQLAEKKNEIARLRENLTKMGIEVETLTEQVAVRSEQVETLNTEKVELENQLNTVYYIVGTEKELREAQIINKQGFIGRTLTVNKTNNLDSFTKTDSRLLSEVPIGQKKVSVVTTHPEDSYELVTDADKVVLKLFITDPVRFWESSKILIISYKSRAAGRNDPAPRGNEKGIPEGSGVPFLVWRAGEFDKETGMYWGWVDSGCLLSETGGAWHAGRVFESGSEWRRAVICDAWCSVLSFLFFLRTFGQ